MSDFDDLLNEMDNIYNDPTSEPKKAPQKKFIDTQKESTKSIKTDHNSTNGRECRNSDWELTGPAPPPKVNIVIKNQSNNTPTSPKKYNSPAPPPDFKVNTNTTKVTSNTSTVAPPPDFKVKTNTAKVTSNTSTQGPAPPPDFKVKTNTIKVTTNTSTQGPAPPAEIKIKDVFFYIIQMHIFM